jgi:hypothetical protein
MGGQGRHAKGLTPLLNAATLGTLALIAVALGYQLYVSVLLVRYGELTRVQLSAQLGLIWLIPLLGAVVCHWFLRLHGVHERRRGPDRAADTLDGAENIPVNDHSP